MTPTRQFSIGTAIKDIFVFINDNKNITDSIKRKVEKPAPNPNATVIHWTMVSFPTALRHWHLQNHHTVPVSFRYSLYSVSAIDVISMCFTIILQVFVFPCCIKSTCLTVRFPLIVSIRFNMSGRITGCEPDREYQVNYFVLLLNRKRIAKQTP